MVKWSIFISLVVLLVSSCSEHSAETVGEVSDEDKSYSREWYYDNGVLKKVQHYDENDVENGIYTFYYPNGVLEDSAEIVNGVLHGRRYLHYENGELKILSNYWYGSIRNSTHYSDDGILETYKGFGYDQNVRFVSHYDRNGKILNHEGDLMYNIVLNDTIERLPHTKIESLVAFPPKSNTTVSIYQKNKQGNLELISTQHPNQENRIIFDLNLSGNDDLEFHYKIEIYDSTTSSKLLESAVLKIKGNGEYSFIDEK